MFTLLLSNPVLSVYPIAKVLPLSFQTTAILECVPASLLKTKPTSTLAILAPRLISVIGSCKLATSVLTCDNRALVKAILFP